MVSALIPLIGLMICGAVIALETKDLLSGIISLGIIGFALTIVFLILQAPDLAIVQIIIETLTLIILIAAVLKTTIKDSIESLKARKVILWVAGLVCVAAFIFASLKAFADISAFGSPVLRMAEYYLSNGVTGTGAVNLVAAIILDFRAYDTLGEATVLFTSVAGVVAVLRKKGRT
ncbi:hypothetical protein DRQ07_05995 [candidate division KSB1 bacterium]|nr:MAG: hypothetical protein DRQ07_05995 [candidate division KSB1 bacterium]